MLDRVFLSIQWRELFNNPALVSIFKRHGRKIIVVPYDKHKKHRLLDKIEELELQYIKHLQKLKEAELAGGYTSSIKKEIRSWIEKKDRYRRRL